MIDAPAEIQLPEDPGGGSRGRGALPFGPLARREVRVPVLLAASWLLAWGLAAVGASIVVFLLIVVVTASLLRIGGGLLDRLVVGTAAAGGGMIASGLLFTYWPWGLSPVAVGGFGLTVLVVVGEVCGRRPSLPWRRLQGTDLLLLGLAGASWYVMRKPSAGKDFLGLLKYTTARRDAMNHYSLFDAIHRIGGYAFLKQSAASHYTGPGMYAYYPSGSHYLWALFDIFLRSTTNPGGGTAELDRYFQYETINCAILAFAVAWAARWVAGPSAGPVRRTFITAAAGGLAGFGQLTSLYWQGFDGEFLGLAFLAVGLAVTIRPPRRGREQILLVALLTVAVCWCYTLFAAYQVAMVLGALVFYRRRVVRHWLFALVVAVVAGFVALVPLLQATSNSVTAGSLYVQAGTSVKFSRDLLVGALLVGLAGSFNRVGWRRPSLRTLGVGLVLATIITAGILQYSQSKLGGTSYYSEKMVEGLWVSALVGLGGAVTLLRGPAPAARRSRLRIGRITAEQTAAVGFAAVIPLVLTAVVPLTGLRGNIDGPGQDVSWAGAWATGHIYSPLAAPLQAYAQRYPLVTDHVTVFIYSDVGDDNDEMTMFGGVLNNRFGEMQNPDLIENIDGLGTLTLERTAG